MMFRSIVSATTTTTLIGDKNDPWHDASEFMRANIATGQALDQLYTKAPKSHDCEGCGAPLQRLAHHCEYCGRQT